MRSLGWALVLSLDVLLAAPQPSADLFAFFRPGENLSTKDRARLQSGTPVVSVLDATGRDIAVFSAIELPPTVTPERFIAWLHSVAEFRRSSYVVNVRRLSTPARREELDELTLDDKDLDDIRECRPRHCGLKLSAAEIHTLRTVVATAGAGWKQALQPAFRDIVLDRVRTYEVRGHAGLNAYLDRKRPQSAARAFSELLKRSTFLTSRAPLVVGRLADGDASAGAPDSFLYWSKEKMGGKSVISATHATIFRGDGIRMPEVLMTGKQVFATHYLDACLGVTGLIRDAQNARSYLVYVNRSDVDLLGGFWGGIARHMIEERIEADGPALLREAARKLASGDPPAATHSPGQR